MREALAVMAKAPRVGRVKTRLHADLGPERATALYACFLRDTLALAARAVEARPGLAPLLCYAPEGDRRAFDGVIARGTAAIPQRGADLGERLANCFRDAAGLGARAVAVIGADSPTLPPAFAGEAFDALDGGADVALGPTVDGGYYLIGARAVPEPLLAGISWSTSRVFAETLERAASAGLSVHVLPEWYDVDEPRDLARLRADLATAADVAPATRAFFESGA